jgi:PPOX class probable F420-dependent enzyme
MSEQATVGARHAVPLHLPSKALRLIRSARVAHLATADAGAQPLAIPICYVFDGKEFFSPIDEKPKRTAPRQLKRVKNILENSRVSLVIDRYDEDWSRLAYVLVTGNARILSSGEKYRKAAKLLRRKYRQYRSMAIHERPMIVIRPMRIASWGAP